MTSVVKYRTEDGVFTAIRVKTGRRYTQVILMDSSGMRIRRVPKSEEQFMRQIDYPLERAKQKFLDAAKRFSEGPLPSNLLEALT